MEGPEWTQTPNGYLGIATRDIARLIALSDAELVGGDCEPQTLAAIKLRIVLREIQDCTVAASALL